MDMDMDIITITIIIVILFIIMLYIQNKNIEKEKFTMLDYNVEGHLPYIYPEYRRRHNYMPLDYNNLRLDKLRSQKWETRLPSLVKQKYSHNDKVINKYNIETTGSFNANESKGSNLKGKARLIELPLNLRNTYHATIDKNKALSDYLWIPHIRWGIHYPKNAHINKKKLRNYVGAPIDLRNKPKYLKSKIISKNFCKNNGIKKPCLGIVKDYNHYMSSRTIAPSIIENEQYKYVGSPVFDNTVHDIARRVNDISGYNPTDRYPAQYADRSKESVEKWAGAELYKAYDEPVHGWLPWEN